MDNGVLIVLIPIAIAYFVGRSRGRGVPRERSQQVPRPSINYAVEQLDVVMKSGYAPKTLMNKGEFRVFKAIEQHIKEHRTGQRLFSQVSMGEVLTAKGAAYDAINSKRLDFLVIGPFGMPEVAIEHQGLGHHSGNAAARDAVKKEALRRAGIPLVETFDTDSDEDILQKVFPHAAKTATR